MSAFMLNREVRRVPLDFDAPLGETWAPLLHPHEFPPCPDCSDIKQSEIGAAFDAAFGAGRRRGDGLTPEARQIAETFYAHHINDPTIRAIYCWHDKISQDEVNYLLSKGRLRTWVPDDSDPRGASWQTLPRTAAEVNALQREHSFDGHDGINRLYLIEYRCERLGIEMECPTCKGFGDLASDEEREAADNWKPPEVPSGPGWQMWQTTTEGGPISPIFETETELAQWLAENGTVSGDRPATVEEWLQVIHGEVVMLDMGTGRLR